MKRAVAVTLAAGVLAGCGTIEGWSKRREARALEKSIAKQQETLKRMSPTALEAAETESREKAIAQYEKILHDYADVGREEMDESLYLLGRLLFEREQQAFQQGQRGFEAARLQAEAQGQNAGAEPKPRYPSAKAVFERLLHDFPESTFREDALYDLGYILTEEGDRAGGAKLFETLIKEKPKSRYTGEVQFRLGEYNFESYQLAAAEKHYEAVLKSGQSDLAEKALFKLGWVYYNQDRYDDAKKVLGDLLRRQTARMEREGREFAPAPILFFPGPRRASLRELQEKETKGADLYQETLEIIARVYGDAGGADALVSFLKSEQRGKTPPRFAAPLMHRLALVQKERSQFDAAAHSYQLLLDTFPTYKDAPKIELEMVDVLLGQKRTEDAAKAREAMLARYDQGSPWARANPEQEVREVALADARKGLEWAIQYYHSHGLELQKEQSGVPQELKHAIALYERYLAKFPDGEASYDHRFRYAQALYAAGEFAKAADVFRVVSFDQKQTAKREEAALSRILCVEKLAEGQNPPLPPRLIDTQVAAYEDYIALNPASDKNPALLFKEGNLYFNSGKFPSAIAAFERLIRDHRGDALAAEANDLVAQAHFRLGDFAAAEQWSEKALAAASPDNPLGKRRDEVEKLYALTMFKQGEKADEEKQYGEASRDYLKLVDKLPQNEISARALYNAASATERAKQKAEAARLFERLVSNYGTSDLAPDAAVRLAEFYKDQPGGTDKIIQIYERVADTHVENPKGEEFLFLAGKLAAKERKAPETTRLFEKFLSRYRSQAADLRGERNVEALYHLGTTYAAAGNVSGARQHLELFLSQPRPAKASFGDEAQGYDYATANARLLLGNMVSEEYRAVRIQTPVAENLKRKESLLNGLVDRYTPAVASGISPLATEASFRIGNAYEDFASAIEDAPRPPGLSSDEQGEYDRLLQGRIRPFLVKAVDAYRVTVRAARQKPLDDPWVGRCRERLAAVAPRAFSRSPRSGYLRLAPATDPPPPILTTFAGVAVSADSGPSFFGSLFANAEKSRLRNFAKGLEDAQRANWSDAADQFLEASKNGPPEAGYNAAVALAQQKKTSQAVRTLEDVMRKSPDFPPGIALAARLYEQNGNRDAAAAAYRKATESPRATAAEKLAWARFLERQKQKSEALGVYQAILATEPANGEAMLGVARLDGSGSAEDLVKLIPPLGRSASSLVELGVLAGERDAPRVAAQAFAAARAGLPSTDRLGLVTVLTDEALAAAAAGELERATALLGSARRVDVPLPVPTITNASGIVLMRRGDFQNAESEFRKAVTAAPTFGPSWANLGILNELYFGAPDQAVDCYNRYLATHPADEPVVTGWIKEIREGPHARNKSI